MVEEGGRWTAQSLRLVLRWSLVGLASTVGVACSIVDDGASDTTIVASSVVTCEPVPRFRLGDIEYENQRFDDQVAAEDLGRVVGEIKSYPPAFDRCEPVVLQDGEGSWPAGTEIYAINGVDPTLSLAASLGAGVYLKFDGYSASP